MPQLHLLTYMLLAATPIAAQAADSHAMDEEDSTELDSALYGVVTGPVTHRAQADILILRHGFSPSLVMSIFYQENAPFAILVSHVLQFVHNWERP